jgi:hypothetical protein
MASTSTDSTTELLSGLGQYSPTHVISILSSFNFAVLMGDSFAGKSLLLARTVEPDLVPDADYTPTNGFVKCLVDTPLGEVNVIELSGQIDTWTVGMDQILMGASLVIILKHDDKPDINWRDMVKAAKPHVPIIESTDMSVDMFRGILSGLALKTYPYRHLMDSELPTMKTAIELSLMEQEKSTYKQLIEMEDSIRGSALIMRNAFKCVEQKEIKVIKKMRKEKKRKDKKSKKHSSKKTKAKLIL